MDLLLALRVQVARPGVGDDGPGIEGSEVVVALRRRHGIRQCVAGRAPSFQGKLGLRDAHGAVSADDDGQAK